MRNSAATCFILTLALGSALTSGASTCTATASGDWESASIWSCGHAPQAGDALVIPLGITVSVYSNIAYTGASMYLRVYGALYFVGSGSKLSFPCGSIIELMTENSTVDGNSSGNSQTIRICSILYWAVSYGRESGYLIWPPQAHLPVELIYFEGSENEGSVELRWATASESNSDRFELHRYSADVADVTLVEVPAGGFTQQLTLYGYQDRVPSAGTWYYRLLQFDLDGASKDLGTVNVRVEPITDVQCFPIPATTELTITTNGIPSTLVLRDLAGRIVLRASLTSQNTAVPINELPNGAYQAQVITGDRSSTRKVQVCH
jgi:hypothetical protein